MVQFVRGIALVATLLATCGVSLAQEDPLLGKLRYAGLSRGGKSH